MQHEPLSVRILHIPAGGWSVEILNNNRVIQSTVADRQMDIGMSLDKLLVAYAKDTSNPHSPMAKAALSSS